MWLLVPSSAIANVSVTIAYLYVRAAVLFSSKGRRTIADQLVLVLEVVLYLPSLLGLTARSFAWKRPTRALRLPTLLDPPSVDILITCCNEQLATISDTVNAALSVDYPQNKFDVIVLDDGACEDLEFLIRRLQKIYSNLYYTARKKPYIPDYKAGNLNHGLAFSASLSETPAAYLAGLDADSIVYPHWLRELMARMASDSRLAIVATPQVLLSAFLLGASLTLVAFSQRASRRPLWSIIPALLYRVCCRQ